MRTSLNNIARAEAFLLKKQPPGDALLFEAALLLDQELRFDVSAQQKVYNVVQQYGRKQLKQEIEAAHQQLFTRPEHLGFKKRILAFFKR
ncbi:MAG TPA: hypothetical protein VIM77_15200 [Mucilaginibacter sp.]